MPLFKFVSSFLLFNNLFLLILSSALSNYDYSKEAVDLPEEMVKAKNPWCPDVSPQMSDYYRYNSRTNKCYQVGLSGPCGQNMVFLKELDDSIYEGICDCSKSTSRTLIYHEGTNQCYSIFQQAYCNPGLWLTLSRSTGSPICEPNPCIKSHQRKDENSPEFLMFNNRCVGLRTEVPECGERKVVDFELGKILPTCTSKYSGYAVAAINQIQPCAAGSLRSVAGGCQKSWVW